MFRCEFVRLRFKASCFGSGPSGFACYLRAVLLILIAGTARGLSQASPVAPRVTPVLATDYYVEPPPPMVRFSDASASMHNHQWTTEGPFLFDAPERVYVRQVLPLGQIYKPYLAGAKESRMSVQVFHEKDDGWLYDATLGSHIGLYRNGTLKPTSPEGFQVDLEGSAQVRLDIENSMDMESVDFRVGLVATWGGPRLQTKFGYYHISSHLGDEFLLANPEFERINFVREVLILGRSYYLASDLRVYAEAGWAFEMSESDPWEFQFGVESVPMHATGPYGAPFMAANAHLREEMDYGDNITIQAGWAWRSHCNGSLMRVGVHYLNGQSSQFSFLKRYESQIGIGIWYDQ